MYPLRLWILRDIDQDNSEGDNDVGDEAGNVADDEREISDGLG